jgi:hypothetical protein
VLVSNFRVDKPDSQIHADKFWGGRQYYPISFGLNCDNGDVLNQRIPQIASTKLWVRRSPRALQYLFPTWKICRKLNILFVFHSVAELIERKARSTNDLPSIFSDDDPSSRVIDIRHVARGKLIWNLPNFLVRIEA